MVEELRPGNPFPVAGDGKKEVSGNEHEVILKYLSTIFMVRETANCMEDCKARKPSEDHSDLSLSRPFDIDRLKQCRHKNNPKQ